MEMLFVELRIRLLQTEPLVLLEWHPARPDFLERYRRERPELSLYLRRAQPVMLLNSGDTVPAYCYVWRSALTAGPTHPRCGE